MQLRDALRGLDATGLALVGVGVWALVSALHVARTVLGPGTGEPLTALALAALAVAALWVAVVQSRAELEATCDHCGMPVRVDSASDEPEMALTIARATGPQRTVLPGGLSIITDRHYTQTVACSPTCAQAIWDRYPTPTRPATVVADPTRRAEGRTAESVAADGGDEPDESQDVTVTEVIE